MAVSCETIVLDMRMTDAEIESEVGAINEAIEHRESVLARVKAQCLIAYTPFNGEFTSNQMWAAKELVDAYPSGKRMYEMLKMFQGMCWTGRKDGDPKVNLPLSLIHPVWIDERPVWKFLGWELEVKRCYREKCSDRLWRVHDDWNAFEVQMYAELVDWICFVVCKEIDLFVRAERPQWSENTMEKGGTGKRKFQDWNCAICPYVAGEYRNGSLVREHYRELQVKCGGYKPRQRVPDKVMKLLKEYFDDQPRKRNARMTMNQLCQRGVWFPEGAEWKGNSWIDAAKHWIWEGWFESPAVCLRGQGRAPQKGDAQEIACDEVLAQLRAAVH